MKKSFILVTVVALLVMLAPGCAPEGARGPTPPAPAATPSPEQAAPTPTPEEVSPLPAPELAPTPEPTPTAECGIIEIRVTDPPPADVTSAVVTAKNIEIHREEGPWVKIIDSATFDLVALAKAEKVDILGSANITAGGFTGIRMDVDSVSGSTTDNVSYTAEVPSGKLRIVRPFDVEVGMKTILKLDFDGEKSLIMAGEGKFLFKPVVKLFIKKTRVED